MVRSYGVPVLTVNTAFFKLYGSHCYNKVSEQQQNNNNTKKKKTKKLAGCVAKSTYPDLEIIKHFSCSTQLSMKFDLLNKLLITKNCKFFLSKNS